jgi:hypothetical protein
VAWCDHRCRWEYETDGPSAVLGGGDLLDRERYLAGFGHPPFRWHSRLWPSGLCLEQNEFLPDANPRYVAEHGRLTIVGASCPDQPTPGSVKPDPDRIARTAVVTAQLAADLAEAAALTRVAPDYIGARVGVPSGLLSAGGPTTARSRPVTGATPARTDAV